uniref:calmodulin-like protein 6 n=1 Tax=Erigeron canadensis TaxID=72917 RepID=UPI001CB8C2F4|nr:calmodulin-like protein 6 [Erigeron canadensis]
MKETIELPSAATAVIVYMEYTQFRLVCLTLLKYFIILCMFVEWVVSLHDLYSLWARPIWRFIFTTQTATCAHTPTVVVTKPHDAKKVSQGEKGCKKLLGIDLKIIMGKLGMLWDNCHDKRHIIGSEEILGLFNDDEPSLDEVKQAFNVFDRNKDGYIDANELRYTFRNMGYIHISETDCRRMIGRYDVDKDAKISFAEFLNVIEDGFL